MAGMAEMALGAAPIAGGAMLGALMGTVKGPDFRAVIKSDIDLLNSLPADAVDLRAALRSSIEQRVYELVATVDRNRELRLAASGYQGNWRDIFVFITALVFTVVWWNVPHSRSNWMVTFIILLVLSGIVGLYAVRGFVSLIKRFLHRG